MDFWSFKSSRQVLFVSNFFIAIGAAAAISSLLIYMRRREMHMMILNYRIRLLWQCEKIVFGLLCSWRSKQLKLIRTRDALVQQLKSKSKNQIRMSNPKVSQPSNGTNKQPTVSVKPLHSAHIQSIVPFENHEIELRAAHDTGKLVAIQLAPRMKKSPMSKNATHREEFTSEIHMVPNTLKFGSLDGKSANITIGDYYRSWKETYRSACEASNQSVHSSETWHVARHLLASAVESFYNSVIIWLEVTYPSSSTIASFRILQVPLEYSEPIRLGDIIVIWSPMRDSGKSSFADRSLTSPLVVDQLIKWCEGFKVIEGRNLRIEASSSKASQLEFKQVYKKLFQRDAHSKSNRQRSSSHKKSNKLI